MADNKILARIKALLAKADSVEGTPEADTFRDKAFELLAKYGIDESMTRTAGGDGPIPGDTMRAATFSYPEDMYGYEKMLLVHRVGQALHCSAVQLRNENTIQLFGLARHMERAKFLIDLLMPQMINSASKARPANPFERLDLQAAKRDLQSHRAEYMVGFADTVHERIKESERRAAGDYDREQGGTGAAVQLASDFDRARRAMQKKYPNLVSARGKRYGGEGYSAGRAAGNAADIGNTRVGSGSKAAIGG
ncbi:DUF2786 domain-containing protein [Rhodococcus rhodochrous]|uniref:DUF2786 domain-containing protein n=1 Tax=Rhodococcus rhodochrous TaxID=1829 RepID=UPI001785E18C|nr:DUF2786 domain-containing protein [Rhodococcus rhodochrous]QOH59907.1 hypothetical protein C6Y44_27855 [Rhodococcus rhodochrous]